MAETRNGLLLGLIPVGILLLFMACSPEFSLSVDDGASSFQPILSDSLRQLGSGRLPLWSHHSSCGYPLVARGQQSLYPVHWLSHGICRSLRLADREMIVSCLLHIFAGTVFAFLYVRFLGAHVLPAVIGALGYGLAGPNLGFWTNWPPYAFLTAWIPLALLIVEQFRSVGASPFWIAAWGLCGGLVLLLTDPMLVIKFYLLVSLYVLLRLDWQGLKRSIPPLLIGFALSLMIGVGQLLATLQLVSMTERVVSSGVDWDDAFRYSCDPASFVALFFPMMQIEWASRFEDYPWFTGGTLFTGPLFGLALILTFTSSRPIPRVQRTLLVLMGLYLMLALGGYFPLNVLIQQLPVMKHFRWPLRWTLELCCLAPLFSALALDGCWQEFNERSVRVAAIAFLVVLTIFVVATLAWSPDGYATAGWFIRAAWLGGAALLAYLAWAHRRQAFFYTAIAFTICTLTINVPLAQRNRFCIPDLRNLANQPLPVGIGEQERVLLLADRREQRDPPGEGSLTYDLPHLFGSRTVLGHRYILETLRWTAGTNIAGEVVDPDRAIEQFLSGHLLETLRVGYVVVPRTNPQLHEACDRHPRLKWEQDYHWWTVYRHGGFRAPAFFVQQVRDEAEIADLSRMGELPLAQTAIVEGRYQGPRQFDGGGEIQRFREEHGDIALEAASPREGFLIVTTNWYPGWRATIDGEAVPIYRVNSSFMGLRVPGGRHRIHLEYRPLALSALLFFGMSVFLGLCVFCLVSIGLYWRQRHQGR